jgi:hypothetical protein
MLEYIHRLFANSDGFLAHIHLKDGSSFNQTGAIKADPVGIVVEDTEGQIRLIPWTSILTLVVEDC